VNAKVLVGKPEGKDH